MLARPYPTPGSGVARYPACIPPFMMNRTGSTALMSSSGLPCSMIKSARLPSSSVPCPSSSGRRGPGAGGVHGRGSERHLPDLPCACGVDQLWLVGFPGVVPFIGTCQPEQGGFGERSPDELVADRKTGGGKATRSAQGGLTRNIGHRGVVEQSRHPRFTRLARRRELAKWNRRNGQGRREERVKLIGAEQILHGLP